MRRLVRIGPAAGGVINRRERTAKEESRFLYRVGIIPEGRNPVNSYQEGFFGSFLVNSKKNLSTCKSREAERH